MEYQTALSPLDGRYRHQLGTLQETCSPAAFARARVRAEVVWLLTLDKLHLPGFAPIAVKEKQLLERLPQLNETDLDLLEKIEWQGANGRSATHHDVKAVEYFIADKLAQHGFSSHTSWVHFALTSEDINSAAYAQVLSAALEKRCCPCWKRCAGP